MLKRWMTAVALIMCLAMPVGKVMAQEAAARTAAGEVNTAVVHAEGAAGEHEKLPLLPSPFEANTWAEALWVVIIFVVLLAILYPTAWKNVLAGLKGREDRIRHDLASAEAARRKADETQKELTAQLAAAEAKVRDIIAKGVADAEKIATSIRSQATADAEAQRERAVKEIESAKHAAIAEVYTQTAELATSIAGKILQRNLNADDQRDLVNRSLEQMQTLGN